MPVDPAIPPAIDPQRRLAEALGELRRRVTALEAVGTLGQIAVVDALPAGQRKGRLVMLSTDNTIYKDTGTAWVAVG